MAFNAGVCVQGEKTKARKRNCNAMEEFKGKCK
jgi:hypothetical protein